MCKGIASVLIVLLVCSFVLADNPYPQSITPTSWLQGVSGNGSIYYQNSGYFTFPNVQNPVKISISYSDGSNFPAEVCLNSFASSLPVPGVFLKSSCPHGAYGSVSNNTMSSGASFSSTPDDATDDTVSAEVYLKPSTEGGGFIVTVPDADQSQTFTINFEGEACVDSDYFPVGSNGQCIEINEVEQTVYSIGAGSWQYLRLSLPPYDAANNNMTVSINGTSDGISLYIQEGYIPTKDWYLITDDNTDDKDVIHSTILTPGTFSGGEIYYLGIFNANDGTRQVSVNTTIGSCSGSTFGYNCQHDSTNTTGTVGGFRTFPATLTSGTTLSATVNNGSSLSYDFNDDDDYAHEYAYFKITDYPTTIGTPYYIRVSAANNDVSDLSGAPAIYAKLGGYPSAQSNHYNMSTTGDVAHQLTLPVTSTDTSEANTWYVAVQLPADFSIWVGVNCADNCDDNEHGECYCDQDTCSSQTNNQTENINVYYKLPSYLQDSAGACTCDSKKYDNSFDCSEKNNGNTAIYIVLIAIGGALVLLAAIAAPVYCYYSSKKAKGYQEM